MMSKDGSFIASICGYETDYSRSLRCLQALKGVKTARLIFRMRSRETYNFVLHRPLYNIPSGSLRSENGVPLPLVTDRSRFR